MYNPDPKTLPQSTPEEDEDTAVQEDPTPSQPPKQDPDDVSEMDDEVGIDEEKSAIR